MTDPRQPAFGPMFDPTIMGPLFEPKMQRTREYVRQRQMSTGDLLLDNRIIFLGSSPETGGRPDITDYLANLTIQKLLFLQYENRSAGNPHVHQLPRRLGDVDPGDLRHDAVPRVPDLHLLHGHRRQRRGHHPRRRHQGKRYALPNSKIMIHQPWGQMPYSQVSDIEINAYEMEKDRQRLNRILGFHTGKSFEVIEKETERDRFFGPEEAKEFGIVDEVLQKLDKKHM